MSKIFLKKIVLGAVMIFSSLVLYASYQTFKTEFIMRLLWEGEK